MCRINSNRKRTSHRRAIFIVGIIIFAQISVLAQTLALIGNEKPYTLVLIDAPETSLENIDTFRVLGKGQLAIKFNSQTDFYIYSGTLKKISRKSYSDIKAGSGNFLTVCEKGKWGLIDSMGNTCIKPKFSAAGIYKDGIIALKKGAEWGFADEKGRWVIPPKLYFGRENGEPAFFEGLATVLNKQNGFWEYINYHGDVEISGAFTNAYAFKGGHAWVEKNSAFYLINKRGLIVLGPFSDVAAEHTGNCVPVFTNDRIGFVIQKHGSLALEPRFFEVGFCQNGYTTVLSNLGWTLIDSSGNFPRNVFFDGLEPVGPNRFVFSAGPPNDLWYGLVSGDGRIVIPAQYRYIAPFNGPTSVVQTPLNKTVLIDKDGNQVLKNVPIKNVLAQCNAFVIVETNERLCMYNLNNGLEQNASWMPQKERVKLVDVW
jgi:hypothetical protein